MKHFLYIHKNLKLIYDRAFPKRELKKTYHTRKPWLTECLKVSIKKKNKLYMITKRHPTTRNEISYKKYKTKLNRLLKRAFKYNPNALSKLQKRSSEWYVLWSHILIRSVYTVN